MSKTVGNDTHKTMPEIFINKVGDSIVITPKDELQTLFFQGTIALTDDFMKDGRPEET